jgi:4-hydroxymandelate oxidase
MTIPRLQAVPAGLVNLADHETLARQTLAADRWAYLHGAAADEITARANLRAWQSMALVPRVMRQLTHGHTRRRLLGHELAHPIFVAPVALQRLAHPDGELASAHAAAAQGAGMVVSTQSSLPLEAIASAIQDDATRGPLWFQLYLQPDRDFTLDLVRRAEASGYEALVLTVDAASSGARDQERRADFRLPPDVQAVNLRGMEPSGRTRDAANLFEYLRGWAPTWEDLAWLRSVTRLPVLLKGILHPQDAVLALDAGASGIVVSNHGGRTLDTTITTARALPAIAAAIDRRIPILVDGGIRRGTDVLKALALGADAVLIGRPIVHGLTNAGALGVAHVLRLLRDELEIAMALTGCATLDDIHPACLDLASPALQA